MPLDASCRAGRWEAIHKDTTGGACAARQVLGLPERQEPVYHLERVRLRRESRLRATRILLRLSRPCLLRRARRRARRRSHCLAQHARRVPAQLPLSRRSADGTGRRGSSGSLRPSAARARRRADHERHALEPQAAVATSLRGSEYAEQARARADARLKPHPASTSRCAVRAMPRSGQRAASSRRPPFSRPRFEDLINNLCFITDTEVLRVKNRNSDPR